MQPNAHCSSVYNSQDMEANEMFMTDEWIKKMWYAYTMD